MLDCHHKVCSSVLMLATRHVPICRDAIRLYEMRWCPAIGGSFKFQESALYPWDLAKVQVGFIFWFWRCCEPGLVHQLEQLRSARPTIPFHLSRSSRSSPCLLLPPPLYRMSQLFQASRPVTIRSLLTAPMAGFLHGR